MVLSITPHISIVIICQNLKRNMQFSHIMEDYKSGVHSKTVGQLNQPTQFMRTSSFWVLSKASSESCSKEFPFDERSISWLFSSSHGVACWRDILYSTNIISPRISSLFQRECIKNYCCTYLSECFKMISNAFFHLGSWRPTTSVEKRAALSLIWAAGLYSLQEFSRTPKQCSYITRYKWPWSELNIRDPKSQIKEDKAANKFLEVSMLGTLQASSASLDHNFTCIHAVKATRKARYLGTLGAKLYNQMI